MYRRLLEEEGEDVTSWPGGKHLTTRQRYRRKSIHCEAKRAVCLRKKEQQIISKPADEERNDYSIANGSQ